MFNIKDRTDEDFKSEQSNTPAIALNGKVISINEAYVDKMTNGENNKTLAHEIGHTGGLKHPAMDYGVHWGKKTGFENRYLPGPTSRLQGTSNFMNQGPISKPTGPTKDQMYRIYQLYRSGKLNNSNNKPYRE